MRICKREILFWEKENMLSTKKKVRNHNLDKKKVSGKNERNAIDQEKKFYDRR